MSWFKRSRSILGINARNLEYIAQYNSADNKKFADNKIFTKRFLESRGIGVAKLYHVVKSYQQLTPDFFASLPESFVVKPNRGLAGSGILVFTKQVKSDWVTASGKHFNAEALYRHCIAILEGRYSISGVHDQVIFEERLEPHADFRSICDVGLPDVRVVVFNMVPIMAMLRVPTYESEGKANMELGAVGMGIDLGSGKTTYAAKKSKQIFKMPNGRSARGFEVPFWDEVLLSAAKIQGFTGIGYLGVDMVITKTGVKVLEVNARAGLKIQVANKTPQKERLKKVADLKVRTPEEGVKIAKTLFSDKKKPVTSLSDKPVIGVLEWGLLHSEKPEYLKVRIDLSAEQNTLSSKHYEDNIADMTIGGKRLKFPVTKGHVTDADMILGAKFVKDFYIDPNKKIDQEAPTRHSLALEERMLRNVDQKVCEIDEHIKLLTYINPRNLSEQRELFLSNPEFDPRFRYRACEVDLEQLRRDLKRIPTLDHPLGALFTEKVIHTEAKLDLLERVGSSEFSEASERVFGTITRHSYKLAVDWLTEHARDTQAAEDISDLLDVKKATKILKNFLSEYKLSHWKISVLEDSVSDIQVTKKNTILLRKGAQFKQNRLEALLVHEIGTHVFRFENGKHQPYRILERGTANYLQTEEGLAIWNQNALNLALGAKFFRPALLAIAIHMGEKMGFVDLFHHLQSTYNLTDDMTWTLCLKVKRGLSDTAEKGSFTKDGTYFTGYRTVEKFLDRGGNITDLYVGKIAVEDLTLVSEIKDLVKPKLLLRKQ